MRILLVKHRHRRIDRSIGEMVCLRQLRSLTRDRHRFLQLGQELGDLWAVPIDRPDEFPAEYAGAVDDVGLRPAVGSVQRGTVLIGVADREHINVVVLEETVVSPIIDIDAHSHDDHAHFLQALLHLDHGWRLLNTRRTPCRPEIQHHDLPAKLAECDLAINLLHREVGSTKADAGRPRATVASDHGYEQSNYQGSSRHAAKIAKNPD